MMRIGRVGNTELECSPFIMLPVLYALLAGQPGTLLLNLLALLLHELCHSVAAHAMGYRVKRIELQPFGFVARIEKRIASRWDELAIASAGPLFSLVTSVACGALCSSQNLQLPGSALIAQFGRINALLGTVNLLPALPLDGGRMAESILRSFLPPRSASIILLLLGAGAGGIIIASSIVLTIDSELRTMMLIMGVFLLLAVLKESKKGREARVDGILRRLEAIRGGDGIPVRFIALHESVEGQEALSLVDSRGIVYILVLNDAMEEIGRLSEASLIDGIAQLGIHATLYSILKLH